MIEIIIIIKPIITITLHAKVKPRLAYLYVHKIHPKHHTIQILQSYAFAMNTDALSENTLHSKDIKIILKK